ncbi:hypothetical protein Btru_042702 [Bulinus truncatus]|nr:hypothetical protein Btru_042702 [Bulinus truncatus]
MYSYYGLQTVSLSMALNINMPTTMNKLVSQRAFVQSGFCFKGLLFTGVLSLGFVLCAAATNLPFRDCSNGEMDLVFLVDKLKADQDEVKVSRRLFNIASLFQKIRDEKASNVRIAILETTAMRAFIPFKPFESSVTLSKIIDIVNNMKKEQTMSQTLLLKDSFKQLKNFWSVNGRTQSQKLTVWLKNSNVPLAEYNLLFPELVDDIYLFIIATFEQLNLASEYDLQLLQRNVLPVDSEDDLQDSQILYMKVCDKCKQGWVEFKSKQKPLVASCYKVIKSPSPINSLTAEQKECDLHLCLHDHWFAVADCPVIVLPAATIICIDEDCTSKFEPVICSAYADGAITTKSAADDKIIIAPNCIYLRGRSGYPLGCPDLSHLDDCEDFICPNDMVKCPFSYCIQVHYIGDKVKDCRYGEDEAYHVQIKDAGLKQCLSSKKSGNIVKICNGILECENMADEKLCPISCPKGLICEVGVLTQNENMSINIATHLEVPPTTKAILLSNLHFSNLTLEVYSNIFELEMSNCSIVGDLNIYFVYDENFFLFTYHVDLSYNNIAHIQAEGFLYNCLNLEHLNLSYNLNLQIVETNAIASNNLRTVDLSFTSISVLPADIFESSYLEFVNLKNTRITSMSWLPYGVQITTLDLTNTQININSVSSNFYNDLKIKDGIYTDHFKLCCPTVLGANIPWYKCHSPPDPISTCTDLLGNKTKRILLLLVTIVAVVGNAAVLIYRFTLHRNILKHSYGVLIVNLTLSDLPMSVYLIIISYADMYYREVYVAFESEWRYSRLCKASGFLSTLSSQTSTLLVLLITIDRQTKRDIYDRYGKEGIINGAHRGDEDFNFDHQLDLPLPV